MTETTINDQTTITDEPGYTNALAHLTLAETEKDRIKDESLPEYEAASTAAVLAWEAVTAVVDAWAARRVYRALQEAHGQQAGKADA